MMKPRLVIVFVWSQPGLQPHWPSLSTRPLLISDPPPTHTTNSYPCQFLCFTPLPNSSFTMSSHPTVSEPSHATSLIQLVVAILPYNFLFRRACLCAEHGQLCSTTKTLVQPALVSLAPLKRHQLRQRQPPRILLRLLMGASSHL